MIRMNEDVKLRFYFIHSKKSRFDTLETAFFTFYTEGS